MRTQLMLIAPVVAAGIGLAAYANHAEIGKAAMLTTVAASAPAAVAVAAPGKLAEGTHPVAVELFTSQGCSSCPPADVVQSRIVSDPRVVAITRPVTYWDGLGWKDTLAKPENTNLQRAYSGRKIPGAGVYTPQSVVQGRSGTVGGRESTIRDLIAEASKLPEPGLQIAPGAAGSRTVSLSGSVSNPAQLSVAALDSSETVAIGRGENGGRKVVYTNVLVGETQVGSWSGGAKQFSVPASALKVSGADRYALIVREGKAGPILAVRYL